MNPPHDHQQELKEELHAEVVAARLAQKEGRYHDAEYHLDRAAQLGAPPKQVAELTRSVRAVLQKQQQRLRSSGRWGFWCGLLGYLLVSLQQPLGWTMGVWIFLAFVLVPGIIGLVIAWRQGGGVEARERFWITFRSGSWAMALYTVVSLFFVGGRLDEGTNAAGHLLAGTLTTLLFALLAGIIAGMVSLLIRSHPVKERRHEPAS